MTALSIIPTRAQFRPGETPGFRIAVSGAGGGPVEVHGVVTRGAPDHARVASFVTSISVDALGNGSREIDIEPPAAANAPAAAGFAVSITSADGRHRAATAFDVAAHWRDAPRYGFFSDFAPDEDPQVSRERADALLALHVNVIQFYDWMYSHHTLVCETTEFTDPLGRRLSHDVGRRKVALAHDRGMAALAYGALYGAEKEFADAHPDWLLYDGRHEQLKLADIFYLQDIRAVSGWRRWIIDQYRDAIARIGFDGIHIDQYGYPKRSLSRASGVWTEVDLTREFPGFVEQACQETLAAAPAGGSIFNLVNAWPLEEMPAVTSDAATYIEVWDPHSTYRDLYDLIRRARELRPGKHVILAAYLRGFHPVDGRARGAMNCLRLAWSAINASGGFHLLAGEGAAVLAEAYYPNYGTLDPAEFAILRRYADFAVRNTAALHGGGTDVAWTQVGELNNVVLLDFGAGGPAYGSGALPGTVWTIGREHSRVTSLSLINLAGLASPRWNSDQVDAPTPWENIRVRAVVTGDVSGVWWDTPDDEAGAPREVEFSVRNDGDNRFLEFTLPRLEFWALVWWERAA